MFALGWNVALFNIHWLIQVLYINKWLSYCRASAKVATIVWKVQKNKETPAVSDHGIDLTLTAKIQKLIDMWVYSGTNLMRAMYNHRMAWVGQDLKVIKFHVMSLNRECSIYQIMSCGMKNIMCAYYLHGNWPFPLFSDKEAENLISVFFMKANQHTSKTHFYKNRSILAHYWQITYNILFWLKFYWYQWKINFYFRENRKTSNLFRLTLLHILYGAWHLSLICLNICTAVITQFSQGILLYVDLAILS